MTMKLSGEATLKTACLPTICSETYNHLLNLVEIGTAGLKLNGFRRPVCAIVVIFYMRFFKKLSV